MIEQGHADVIVKRPTGTEVSIGQLGPGEHFGETELLQDKNQAVASIKATQHSPVQVLTIERPVFSALMAEAHAMREKLWQIVQNRLQHRYTGFGYAQATLA
jgi:CRP-like cAMP-binding protein